MVSVMIHGSDQQSGKRGMDPAGTSPFKPAKKPVTEHLMMPGARQNLFPEEPAAPDGPQDEEVDQPATLDDLVDFNMEAANHIEPY